MNRFLILLLACAPAAFCQLTTDQKVADFTQLASLYAKYYAPYEWKRDVMKFDLYDVKPWLDRVKATTDDLSFYDICVEYVAALQDSHDEYTLPSDFYAYIPLDVDIYDGKVLIDGISRSLLPSKDFPINIGDELVSVDGKTAEELIKKFLPYAANGSGNPSTRRRLAADAITYRFQAYMPRAHEVGDNAIVVIRSADGNENTYTIPWQKSGTPLLQAGPVPGFKTQSQPLNEKIALIAKTRQRERAGRQRNSESNPWGVSTGAPVERVEEQVPEYLKPLRELQVSEALASPLGAAGFGATTPVFNPPAGFRTRLGGTQFLSGTFPLAGKTIGFIRIPTMSPSNSTQALQQFQSEIAYFEANTDALVIDVMRNGGGSLCYIESLMKFLNPRPFRGSAYYIRASQYWVQVFSSTLYAAKAAKADQWIIDLSTVYLQQVQQALRENRGMTGAVPICTPNFENIQPATDSAGKNMAYTKPILTLVDDFTLSAAEAFSSFLQDCGRAVIFGVRTDGGGGNPATYQAGVFSEGNTRVTRTFVTRSKPAVTPGFPPVNHMENVGVYPDVMGDYMTRENLMNGGKNFIQAFTTALQDMLK